MKIVLICKWDINEPANNDNSVGSNGLKNGKSDSKIFKIGRGLIIRFREIDYFRCRVEV